MTILAVDLAAKFSAACLMNDDFEVIEQFDSFGISEEQFIYQIANYWQFIHPSHPKALVIEDLPHGLKYSTLVKAVCRLQGRIAQAMYETTHGGTEEMLFVAPAAWRAHYDGMGRGTGPEAVFDAAANLGYEPPDLTERAKGNGGRARATKVESDYCAAFLIGHWAVDMKREHGTYDVPGTSRYHSVVIRKKDFDDKDS